MKKIAKIARVVPGILLSMACQMTLAGPTCEDDGLISGKYPSGPTRVVLGEGNKFEICGAAWDYLNAEAYFFSSEDDYLGPQPFSHGKDGWKLCAVKNVIFNSSYSLGDAWVMADEGGIGVCKNISVQAKRPRVERVRATDIQHNRSLVSATIIIDSEFDQQYSARAFQTALHTLEVRCVNSGSWTSVAKDSPSNRHVVSMGCDFDARATVSDGYFKSTNSKSVHVEFPYCARRPIDIGMSCNEGSCNEAFSRTCSSAGGNTIWEDGGLRCVTDKC